MEKLPNPKETLGELAKGAIKRLESLPQPVVRVSGPLTSGGFGYDENLKRFVIAQQKLREQELTVYDYFEDNSDEEIIKSLGVSWQDVMNFYHQPILETGLIQAVYMMPKSEESNGAKMERDYFQNNNLEVNEIPSEWFE